MGNPYPLHTCTVGPFDSYHSNVVNRLTRLVSNDEDCVLSSDKIEAVITSANILTLLAGSVIKDDVFITIEDTEIDFNDSDYYYYGSTWDEIGYYYVVLYYIYEKSRPAPRPKIQILKPSERGSYVPGGDFVLLQIIKVECSITFYLDNVFNYDPENPLNRVVYSKTYIGIECDLPVFDVGRDPGRLLLTTDDYLLQYGGETDWITLGSGASEADLENLRIFVGSDGPGDTTPDYTSIRHIVQNTSLETAISKLDRSISLSNLVKVITNNDTTPSILSDTISPDGTYKICGIIRLANTIATNVINFDDAPVPPNEGITIVVTFENSNSTVKNDPGRIDLVGSLDFNGQPGDSLLLVSEQTLYNGGAQRWREVARTTLFNVDHDPVTGYHRLGSWHIGAGVVGATVTAANLISLTDGSDIGIALHQHSDYEPGIISPHSGRTSNENQHPSYRGWGGAQESHLDFWLDTSHTPHRLWIIGQCISSTTWDYRNNSVPQLTKGISQSGLTIELSPEITILNVVSCDWRYDGFGSAAITEFTLTNYWNGSSCVPLTSGSTSIMSYPGSPLIYANKWFPYGGSNGNAYAGTGECFELDSLIANKFGLGFSTASSGDVLYLEISGDTDISEIELEVIYKKYTGASFNQVILGAQILTKGWGSQDHRCYFNFRGRIFEL